ncbi:glycosyltransferase [Pedobacter metabolipauper]|uniref:Glycosyl transferase family 2 n=1 Tax=Pedobacter metabolipauper TaxID=425513 RepID=A0A4R6SW88_9SPHI|nr:glycosyltransferase [Pedobacter metabolipauper]TDQ09363.1 glycosyl transferase family 2 [Pedobacter metabolipauper]
MSLPNAVDYSIIICTYNPDRRLLERCLNAVSLLDTAGLVMEVILVDNNSSSALYTLDYVQFFLNAVPHSKLIVAREQGLSYARIAGIEASVGKYILFFDDDNEPDPEYVQVQKRLHAHYPHVAAWGPGNVNVDFIEGVDDKLAAYATEAFQDRHEVQIGYSNQRTWQGCYPFGTGLCIKREYFESYALLAAKGKFSLSDRKGNQLSSGGDVQMVLYCISTGAAAGVAPELKLTHIIPGKRTKIDYLKKLTYGTSVCYSTCLLEIFPDHLATIKSQMISERKFAFKVLKKYLMLFFDPRPKKALKLAAYIGAVAGDYIALNKPVPSGVLWVLKRLKAI